MTNIQEVNASLDQMFGVYIDIDIPTGRKSNLAEDLKLTQAPPDNLKISLGQKPTFDPKLVKEMNTLRSQAHRACCKSGIRFMGGYAIPNAEKKAVLDELEDIKNKFEASANDFFSKYPTEVQRWADEAGEYAEAFAGAADSIEVVRAKTKYRVFTYPLGEANIHAEEEGASNTLVSQLFREISVDATALWRDSFHAKGKGGSLGALRTEATLALVRPFDRIRSKLDGLSFIDPTINRVVSRVDEVLKAVRLAGSPIQGASLQSLQGLCFLLKDEMLIREFAEGDDDAADEPFLAAVPTVAPQQDDDFSDASQLPMVVNGSTAAPAPQAAPVAVQLTASPSPAPSIEAAALPDFSF